MGNNISIRLSFKKQAKLKEGTIILYKHLDFKGENSILKYNKNIYKSEDIDIDNNLISSIILGPNTKIILYNRLRKNIILENKTVDYDYYYNLKNKSKYWDNIISSIDVKKYNNQIYKKSVNNKKFDYIVKVIIGGKEYKFNYGAYHKIWLNTNENIMIVDINNSNSTIVEFWTGYHPEQGRRILIDRKNHDIIENKGIIRSLRVKFIKKLEKNVHIDNNLSITKNYQKHKGIRDNKVKKRSLFEYFTELNNNKINYNNQFIFLLIILYLIINI